VPRPFLCAVAVGLACLAVGCDYFVPSCGDLEVKPGETVSCVVPGYTDRAFDLRTPSSWDGSSPLPVILAIHGGGATRGAADGVTCPEGDLGAPECLGNLAAARGYALISPDGVGARPLRGVRTWNAGGGDNGFICAFGPACNENSDDVTYIADVFDEVAKVITVDPARIYATGISNGGAMSHRLACEDPRFAAIAPVSGTNIHADSGAACSVTVPILDMHGTDDPVLSYDGGGTVAGNLSSVDTTMENWRIRNGCAETFVDTALPDRDPEDHTTSVLRVWDNCAATTERIRIEGGGHTWPSGNQYGVEDIIGRVAKDFGTEIILDFFDAHPHA
jgi:polyhydroxybutyrate depolymerase